MKLHLPETFLTQAQSIIREGPKQNPRRLRKKSAKAQKKIGKGSKKDRQRLKKRSAKAQKKIGEGSIIFF